MCPVLTVMYESYSHGKLDRDEPFVSLRVCRGSVYPDTLMGRLIMPVVVQLGIDLLD